MSKNVSLKIGKHKSRTGGLTAAGRKKYKNGAVYIDARANKLLRYDKGQNSFVDISDQVDLSEIM